MAIEEKTRTPISITNDIQKSIADKIKAQYGPEEIYDIVFDNDDHVIVYFRDGSVKSFYYEKHTAQLIRDENPDYDRNQSEERYILTKEQEDQAEEPEVERHRSRRRR